MIYLYLPADMVSAADTKGITMKLNRGQGFGLAAKGQDGQETPLSKLDGTGREGGEMKSEKLSTGPFPEVKEKGKCHKGKRK